MESPVPFEELRREQASWWYVSRRKILRDALAQALRERRDAVVLDYGCGAEIESDDSPGLRLLHAHSALSSLAFHQMQGRGNLICTAPEELAFCSNAFDAAIAGDVLHTVPDDVAALRELRRVLKDGAPLCLTVPAYPSLWGEKDEAGGHCRRYTASGLRRKLNVAGFEVTRVSYVVAVGLLPAVVERIGKSIFTKTITRAPARASNVADSAMVLLLDCERFLIRFINLPFGTRLICWARKPAIVAERVPVSAWERQWSRAPLPQGM